MEVAGLILPVFAVIVTGWAAGFVGYVSRDLSDGLIHFAYNVAMPALLVVTIAQEPARSLAWQFLSCGRPMDRGRCCRRRSHGIVSGPDRSGGPLPKKIPASPKDHDRNRKCLATRRRFRAAARHARTASRVLFDGHRGKAVVGHTVKAYDRDLDALAERIAGMRGVAEKMVCDAMDGLATADTVLAYHVVATDVHLNLLQREIEELAVKTIARHQPVAIDLRELIGVMRVAGDLDRVGDLARSIAERTVETGDELRFPGAIRGLKRLTKAAAALLKDALDAYAQRDAERAREVWERDDDLDAIEEGFSRQLLTHMMEDPRHISLYTHLLFCSKNIERIGDHATNIAETVVYVVTGEAMSADRTRRPKVESDLGAGEASPGAG